MTETTEETWRRLALQFDAHRMRAIALLRHALASGLQNRAEIEAFLAAPPQSGDEVLAERIAALTVTPQRCAECDCENGGDECTWIAPAKPDVTPQEAAKVLLASGHDQTTLACLMAIAQEDSHE